MVRPRYKILDFDHQMVDARFWLFFHQNVLASQAVTFHELVSRDGQLVGGGHQAVEINVMHHCSLGLIDWRWMDTNNWTSRATHFSQALCSSPHWLPAKPEALLGSIMFSSL